MAVGDIMPGGGSHRKRPISRREIERRRQLFKQVPRLQKETENAAKEDLEAAEELLDTHLF